MEVQAVTFTRGRERHAMGESQLTLFQPNFNRSIRVEARPQRLTADAGTLLLRELMDRTGLSRSIHEHLVDLRDADRITHPLLELVRTRILLDAQGYPDQVDANVLRDDPALRLSVSERRGLSPLRSPGRAREPEGLASQPTLSRTLDALTVTENLEGLDRVLHQSAARLSPHSAEPKPEVTFDLDSLPIEVHGHQPGSAYNGHFRACCYHPLLLRNHEGFYLAGRLREGNAHTADGSLDFVLPILREERRRSEQVWLRMDAGFPEPALLGTLEEERIRYVARLRSNTVLEQLAQPYLRRPPGRPPAEGRTWLHELRYRAKSWSRARRVVLVVLERPGEQGELFLDHFFLLTNASQRLASVEHVLRRYRERGTAEKDFGDWKNALSIRLSSAPRPKRHYRGQPVRAEITEPDSFSANEARLLLSLLAANLLHAATLLLNRSLHTAWSRERFRQLVLKAAGRVLVSGRRIIVAIDAARARLWRAFWRELVKTHPARGSPTLQALPTPA